MYNCAIMIVLAVLREYDMNICIHVVSAAAMPVVKPKSDLCEANVI